MFCQRIRLVFIIWIFLDLNQEDILNFDYILIRQKIKFNPDSLGSFVLLLSKKRNYDNILDNIVTPIIQPSFQVMSKSMLLKKIPFNCLYVLLSTLLT